MNKALVTKQIAGNFWAAQDEDGETHFIGPKDKAEAFAEGNYNWVPNVLSLSPSNS